MSWTKETTIWCDGDGCEEFRETNDSRVSDAERKIITEGEWTKINGNHYCPTCSDLEE